MRCLSAGDNAPPDPVTHATKWFERLGYSDGMSEPVRILHLTDPHLHAHQDAMMRGLNTYETFMAIIEHVEAGKRKPDAAAANYLRMIQADPEHVQRTLAA